MRFSKSLTALAILPDGLRRDAMSAVLARNWWAIFLRGLIAVLFGLAAFLFPFTTLASLLLLFGAYMLADGVLAAIAGFRAASHHERWGFLGLESLANLAVGCAVLFAPSLAMLTLITLLGIWSLLSGGVIFAAALQLHRSHGQPLLALSGLVSILWGVLLFISPVTGAMILAWWLGGYALVFGAMLLWLGFHLKTRRVG